MKQTFQNLLTLQDHIDFDKFYSIDITSYGDIKFQGNYSNFLLKRFIDLGMNSSINTNGFIQIKGEINNIQVKITLT